MVNRLVVFYSKSGNNAYLAERLSDDLEAEIQELTVIPRSIPWLMLASILNLKVRIAPRNIPIEDYNEIVLLGPIWLGTLVAPLRTFLLHYKFQIKQLRFITVCGSDEHSKDGKYGYERVFHQVAATCSGARIYCHALPIGLTLDLDQRGEDENTTLLRLNDATFRGDFENAYQKLLIKLKCSD